MISTSITSTILFKTFFLFLVIDLSQQRIMLDLLTNLCPDYLELLKSSYTQNEKVKYSQQKTMKMYQMGSKMKASDVGLRNIKTFSELLAGDLEMVGSGSFGQVFLYDYFLNSGNDSTCPVAAKLQTVNDDYNIKKGRKEQLSMYKEIRVNVDLNQRDPNNFFFLKFRKCYELTSYFMELSGKQESLPDYMNVDESQAKMLIFLERMELSLGDYMDAVFNNEMPAMSFVNRLQMGVHMLLGMQIMNTIYLHCDIKPDNVMLRRVTHDEISLLSKQKLQALEIGKDKFYIVKYIDLGLSQTTDPKKTNKALGCQGGSPGFLASNHFYQDSEYINYDEVSLGLTLLSMELLMLGYEGYENILAITQNQKLKGVTAIGRETRKTLESFP